MKIIKNLVFVIIAFLVLFNIPSFSQNLKCLDVKVIPIQDSVKIEKNKQNKVSFNVLIKNQCNKSFDNLTFFYRGYVFYASSEPQTFNLKEKETKNVKLIIYVPDYLSSGWKGAKIELLDKKENRVLKDIFVTFYLENPNYKVVEKVKYIYLKLINNLDLLIQGPDLIKTHCEVKKIPFNIIIKNVDLKQLKNASVELIVIAKNDQGNEIPLIWQYKNKETLIKEGSFENNSLIIKDFLILSPNIQPGVYKIKAILMIRQGKDYELSEEAVYNVFIKGNSCFKVEKEYFRGLTYTKKLFKITNYGNKEGSYQLIENLNWFKKIFLEYSPEGKIENNKLIITLNLKPNETKQAVIEYDYTALVILILLLLIFGGIYYYLNYYKPFSFKKDLIKIQMSKGEKNFYLEVNIKNNSLRTLKNVVVVEKVNGAEVDELSIYPKYDKVKNNKDSAAIRWEFKEIKPQQKIKLMFKIKTNKSKGLIISQPTSLKVDKRIYLGKGLKIYVGENIKFEEFEV